MKHTLAWIDADKQTVTLDYRPVHTYTMSNEVAISSRRRGCIEGSYSIILRSSRAFWSLATNVRKESDAISDSKS